MHQRTWLSVLTLPLVATFTYPLAVRPADPPKAEAKPSQDPMAGLSDIQDVLALVRDNYVDPPNMENVLAGGIQGALERAHPLNAYLSPEEVRAPLGGTAEAGLRLVKRGIYAQVIGVVAGGPAARAGIQVGDVVRKIDGHSLASLSAWSLEAHLRGTEGAELVLLRYGAQSAQVSKVSLKLEKPGRSTLTLRRESKATVLGLPDLGVGRFEELKGLLGGLDQKLPLVLDLRQACGGDLEEAAKVAGLFAGAGPFATVQEAGKADREIPLPASPRLAFAQVALLQGPGTVGAAELLAAYFRKVDLPTLGERTAALGVERNRILLRQGGAVELVTKRWTGAGGEKLDRQGVAPEITLRAKSVEEDLLPRVLESLQKRLPKEQRRPEVKPTVARKAATEPQPEVA